MKALSVDIALDVPAVLGEGPIWDERLEILYWIDTRPGLLHRFRPSDGSDSATALGQPLGAVALGLHGGLVFAVEEGFGLLVDPDDTSLRIIAVEKDVGGRRMNDGRCDASGRFWAGTQSWDWTPGVGSLYRLEGRDSGEPVVRRMLGGITIANGIDWSPENDRMYYIDSPTYRVDMFEFDSNSGTLGRRRAFIEVDKSDGMPDGMVVDSSGGVWVAFAGGGCVRRYTPDGRRDMEVRVPVTKVTSAAFGGADLADLYITTASIRFPGETSEPEAHAGSLFVCRPGQTGKLSNKFRWV